MRSATWVLAAVGLFAAMPLLAQDPNMEWHKVEDGLLNGSKAVIENEPCCGPTRGSGKDDDFDAEVLATLPGIASRDGETLRLKLAGGRTLRLNDCTEKSGCDAEDTRVHWMRAWWPQHRLHVVEVGLYEESVAYLIDERDGSTLVTTAPPVLSPSGRWAVALVSDLMSGVNLELLDLASNPPVLTRVTDAPTCAGSGPDTLLRPSPVWLDEQQVTFEGQSQKTDDDPNTKQLLRIVDGKPQWQC
jgi:hypothetical protein